MDDAQIKHMVDRFLMWKVPADFSPDGGVKFDPHRDAGGGFHRPIGTNILTATQAEAMIRHLLEGLPAEDSAAAFDKADFFWRTLDPDDSGDNPSEALARGMVGSYTVCEVASSFTGPGALRVHGARTVAFIEMTRREFIDFVEGGRETLQP